MGAFSGMIVSAALHPLEVLKIGIIINPTHYHLKGISLFKQFNIIATHINKTEGKRGFFRGLIPELSRCTVSSAMYFYILKELEHI
jgi:hypothetical protein